MTMRLTRCEAITGTLVDIVPARGEVAELSTQAATGVIHTNIQCSHEGNIRPTISKADETSCIVQVTKV